MTLEEKKFAIDEFCETQATCDTCPLGHLGLGNFCDNSEEIINENFDYLVKKVLIPKPNDETEATETTETPTPVEHDPVNHPSHYCRENAMECIDEMITLFGREKVMAFCLCNAWKYRYRASNKNGQEDLNKSDWYIKKYKELSQY